MHKQQQQQRQEHQELWLYCTGAASAGTVHVSTLPLADWREVSHTNANNRAAHSLLTHQHCTNCAVSLSLVLWCTCRQWQQHHRGEKWPECGHQHGAHPTGRVCEQLPCWQKGCVQQHPGLKGLRFQFMLATQDSPAQPHMSGCRKGSTFSQSSAA